MNETELRKRMKVRGSIRVVLYGKGKARAIVVHFRAAKGTTVGEMADAIARAAGDRPELADLLGEVEAMRHPARKEDPAYR